MRENPKFSMCYSNGSVTLPIVNDTPEPIRVLLTDTRVNANGKVVWTDRTAHFQQNIRSYNNAVSFTSLRPNSIERSLIPWMRRVSIRFESRVLFITPWGVFFLLPARDPVSHRFTCSTPLKSNWTCGQKLTQICNSMSFNCWVQSFEWSIPISNFGKIQLSGSQRMNNWLSDS